MTVFWRNWRITILLLLVVLVPIALTFSRLLWLAGGEQSVQDYPEYAHMMSIPAPIVLHIVFGSIFCLIACFQFNPHLRSQMPKAHRIAGRVGATAGLVSAITGSMMTIVYPIGELSTVPMAAVRFAFGVFMSVSIIIAISNARRRQFAAHCAWMIRAFAIGVAGSTQAILLIACFVALGGIDKYVVTSMICLGFGINWAIAELRIRTTSTTHRQHKGSAV